jgi:hypothetical protein
MSEQEYQIPDLASVLKTLASLAPQGQQPNIAPSEAFPHSSESSRAPPPSLKSASVPGSKLIDPATIVDWSSGLRCVVKTIAAHDNIIKEIRRVSWFLIL